MQFLSESFTDRLVFRQFLDRHFPIGRTQTETSPQDSFPTDTFPTRHFPARDFLEWTFPPPHPIPFMTFPRPDILLAMCFENSCQQKVKKNLGISLAMANYVRKDIKNCLLYKASVP